MAQIHRSDPNILGRRTLRHDHRRLAEILKPGMHVLDVGCGTGSITAGIADAVGSSGTVVGLDRDTSLLDIARNQHSEVPNLRFERGDATSLEFTSRFDVVTAARTLQWISDPALAVSKMKIAAKPGGVIVVLDYNHSRNAWQPAPPPEFTRFYEAFLKWRQVNGWDNEMGDRLPDLFRQASLEDIEAKPQDETVRRGDSDFTETSRLWSSVIEGVGPQMAAAGFCTREQMEDARHCYAGWVVADLMQQTLVMRAVSGKVP